MAAAIASSLIRHRRQARESASRQVSGNKSRWSVSKESRCVCERRFLSLCSKFPFCNRKKQPARRKPGRFKKQPQNQSAGLTERLKTGGLVGLRSPVLDDHFSSDRLSWKEACCHLLPPAGAAVSLRYRRPLGRLNYELWSHDLTYVCFRVAAERNRDASLQRAEFLPADEPGRNRGGNQRREQRQQ